MGDRKLEVSRGHRLSRSNTNQEKEPTLACVVRKGVNEGGTTEFQEKASDPSPERKLSFPLAFSIPIVMQTPCGRSSYPKAIGVSLDIVVETADAVLLAA